MILLETTRLIVKSTSLDQLENAYALYSDPEVMHYLGGPKSRDDTKAALQEMIWHEEKHGFSSGNVYEKETDLFVGRSGLLYLAFKEDQPDIEVGYVLHKAFWNKGYATELAKGFIAWGFQHLSVDKLVATTSLKNMRSRHVLEKVGMHYVGNINYASHVYHFDYQIAKYEILKP